MAADRLATIDDAVRAHVRPGMHLNFASTPSRSNAAVRAVARAFRGLEPGFAISSTGFHSTAHLLPMLGLGRRYIACFFGDNYPMPRPHPLYERLHHHGQLEAWSLGSYVSALRAGALGHPFALTHSLVGSHLAHDLARTGAFRPMPPVSPMTPASPGSAPSSGRSPPLGLVAAMRPDITFVHGLLGDATGNVVFAAPYSEGFWGALGATTGVIVTVERVVDPSVCAGFADSLKIPAGRVRAVCEAPFGAHPQPLYAPRRYGVAGYVDDFDHYELWRSMALESSHAAPFLEQVLAARDDAPAYLDFVGRARLDDLAAQAAQILEQAGDRRPSTPPRAGSRPSIPPTSVPRSPAPPPPVLPEPSPGPRAARRRTPTEGIHPDQFTRANAILVVLAARKIIARVLDRGYPYILAGIGHSFLAARIAKLLLAERGVDVKVMVETGLFDLECGPAGDGFLLSYRSIAHARRHSSVEDVLGTLTCGADSRCLGVIGAAQIDEAGNLNSSVVGGRFLVGSGGANDIATMAAEVIAVSRCSATRLRPTVDYVTSPGHHVLSVATDLCSFSRPAPGAPWTLEQLYPAYGGRPPLEALDAIKAQCPWSYLVDEEPEFAPIVSTHEMSLVHTLDPHGIHWRRRE